MREALLRLPRRPPEKFNLSILLGQRTVELADDQQESVHILALIDTARDWREMNLRGGRGGPAEGAQVDDGG